MQNACTMQREVMCGVDYGLKCKVSSYDAAVIQMMSLNQWSHFPLFRDLESPHSLLFLIVSPYCAHIDAGS